MVVLNKIYTKTGDGGTTALGTGERVPKAHLRIEAYGTVDETNACLGVARLHCSDDALKGLDDMLARIQNDLFDLGADLCVPDDGEDHGYEPLRINDGQVERVEQDIDALNDELEPLRSFVLPGGHAAAAQLHVCRTVCRRAERVMTALAELEDQPVSDAALKFVNRLSDFFFVASRWVNAKHGGDVLWQPGKSQQQD
ncbi:MAG: cob(I)yrinic acid a,c-diamide adenosyltransferase [Hyphomicrobiales bacterium]|nr:cob(I)yrinic acid a,c-diamide adenosyltransferase [Hyphomicrobiales bacterium]